MSVVFTKHGDLERRLEAAGVTLVDGCRITRNGDGWVISGDHKLVAELEADLRSTRRMLGYVIHEAGGEVTIKNFTMFMHEDFSLEREDIDGGIELRARPAA
jgi:hypothetical protein